MVAAGYEMRVGDAEREAAATELREHFASGRLNSEELDQRLTAAFAARTRGDLDALFSDLPAGGRDWDGAGGQAGARQWGPAGAGDGYQQWQARGAAWGSSAGRTAARLAAASLLIPALLILGVLGLFGIGTGRPLAVVLLFAAFALLRRLIRIFSGRRRGPVGRGPCGPRGRRC
jgi:hypothetical protein